MRASGPAQAPVEGECGPSGITAEKPPRSRARQATTPRGTREELRSRQYRCRYFLRVADDVATTGSPLDAHDLAAPHKHRAALTDEPIPLVAASRNGTACSGLQAVFGPDELLRAWRPR
ncbi:hypothetical protein GCM10022227_09910 [Streptomyces sedi]